MTSTSFHRRPRSPGRASSRLVRRRGRAGDRRGTSAIEAAVILPVIVLLMLGMWEMGAMVKAQQVITNAAREGARLAAGGKTNGADVTVAMVQQAVRDYMTANGISSTAVSGATITLTNLSSNSWTNPVDAKPLDRFRVTITIPSGTAYNSLLFTSLNSVTGATDMTVTQDWLSNNDALVTVDATLPY